MAPSTLTLTPTLTLTLELAPHAACVFFSKCRYTPEGGVTDDTTKLAVVGKGLTFDSGGYNPNPNPKP